MRFERREFPLLAAVLWMCSGCSLIFGDADRPTLGDSPDVEILPADAKTADDLKLVITRDAKDGLGRTVVDYRIRWLLDGRPVETLEQERTVPATETQKNQMWGVEVTPVVGGVAGKTATASIIIQNTPPTVGALRLLDYRPMRGTVVQALASNIVDPDGDAQVIEYTWQVGDDIVESDSLDLTGVPPGTEITANTRVGELGDSGDAGLEPVVYSETLTVGPVEVQARATHWRRILPSPTPNALSRAQTYFDAENRRIVYVEGDSTWELPIDPPRTWRPLYPTYDSEETRTGVLGGYLQAKPIDRRNGRILQIGGAEIERVEPLTTVFALNLKRGREHWVHLPGKFEPPDNCGLSACEFGVGYEGEKTVLYVYHPSNSDTQAGLHRLPFVDGGEFEQVPVDGLPDVVDSELVQVRDTLYLVGGRARSATGDSAGGTSALYRIERGNQWKAAQLFALDQPSILSGSAAVDDAENRIFIQSTSQPGVPDGSLWQLELSGAPKWSKVFESDNPEWRQRGSVLQRNPTDGTIVSHRGVINNSYSGAIVQWTPNAGLTTIAKTEATQPAARSGATTFVNVGAASNVADYSSNLVLFSGDGPNVDPSKTWALNELEGRFIETAPLPSPYPSVRRHPLPFTPRRGAWVVDFPREGGVAVDQLTISNETTERKSVDIATTSTPETREDFMVVAWTNSGNLLSEMLVYVIGGSAADGNPEDTAILNCSTIQPKCTWCIVPDAPDSNIARARAFITEEEILVFGGQRNFDPRNKLWSFPTFDGDPLTFECGVEQNRTWTELNPSLAQGPFDIDGFRTPSALPEPRIDPTLTLSGDASSQVTTETIRKEAVLFGGRKGTTHMNDVWILRKENEQWEWVEVLPSDNWGTPPPRALHAAFYDHPSRRFIIFGGARANAVLGDMWELRFVTKDSMNETDTR